ncbi:hypothetical protein MKW92_035722 [Papaver armeniacum]|nr:hypothetical protein MKW92_035722 [Papaver armeniacum]
MTPPAKIPSPLQHGRQWGARDVQVQPNAFENVKDDIDYDDGDNMIGDRDDDIYSDGSDSDESQKSHETRKKNRCIEETNSSMPQCHCPACQNGPGKIDWFKGFQPKDIRGRKRTSVVLVGEVHGKWHGLHQSVSDKEIVWRPTVVVMNTLLDQDENEKGTGGMSLLIFEGAPTGSVEAERLHNYLIKEGRDKDARWTPFDDGGISKLYGFIASKKDMDSFNHHSKGSLRILSFSCTSKMKFEMRSYVEMVVIPMKQMSEDNQQLIRLMTKDAKNQRNAKAMEETIGVLSERLQTRKERSALCGEEHYCSMNKTMKR